MSQYHRVLLFLLLGDSPIIGATVTAVIERPGSSGPVTIQVRDNGAGMFVAYVKCKIS